VVDNVPSVEKNEKPGLTLSPPAVKTQWFSQCQAFQRLVRSSHTLVNWTFDLLNRFSISLACFWKHWMLFAFVCDINTLGQWQESLGQTSQSLCSSFSGRTNVTSALSLEESHNCDFGSEKPFSISVGLYSQFSYQIRSNT
jgi:hypothetical protein